LWYFVPAKLAHNTYSGIGYPGIYCWYVHLFIPLGFTINTLTLFGFVLAIGIVVDDAIVVVEAVQHYMDEKGMSPARGYQARHA
jgi:preprotein translocase subunit SecD